MCLIWHFLIVATDVARLGKGLRARYRDGGLVEYFEISRRKRKEMFGKALERHLKRLEKKSMKDLEFDLDVEKRELLDLWKKRPRMKSFWRRPFGRRWVGLK